MKQLFWIGLGSGIGGAFRYILDFLALQIGFSTWPLSTLCINVCGSLLIGYLAGLWSTGGAITPHPYKWHFWVTGICGGFTTFSTFSWQILELIQRGEGQVAGFYAAASVGFGLIAVWVGLSIAMRGRASNSTN